MDLIAIGKHITSIEEKHLDGIKQLNFLGFNLWKVYRNYICNKLYAQYQVGSKEKLHINKNLWSLVKSFKRSKNKVFIRTTSAFYNQKDGEAFKSPRLDVIKNAIIRQGNEAFVVGILKQEKVGKLSPEMDLPLDSLVRYYSFKLKRPMSLFVLLSSWRHANILNSIEPIPYKTVTSIQTMFVTNFLIFWLYYNFAKPKKVLFLFSSYGNEAEIAALKKLGVEVLEYQHGYIYPEHYGYNYSKVLQPLKHKLLVPDKFFAYGQHWKEILLEIGFFGDDDIVVAGNPDLVTVDSISLDTNGKTAVLVCSQPNSAHLFRDFIEHYSAHSDYSKNYYWIVKLHPREALGEWQAFVKKMDNVTLSHENTYSLLKAVDLQLTGSSTTLYEALYFGVSNYILLKGLQLDKSSSFEEGIGKVITADFVDKIQTFDKILEGEKYFEEFNFAC